MSRSNRYFENDPNVGTDIDTQAELLSSLERINTFNPPVQTCSTGWTFNGLYGGPTSIAYLFYRLHLIYPELEFKQQSLFDWAQAYVDLSAHVRKRDPGPDDCGIANESLAYCMLKALMLKDTSLVSQLCSYQFSINAVGSAGSNEWLYGRAGYLYYLRAARSQFSAQEYPSAHKQLKEAIQNTIVAILKVPQPWTWYDQIYIGAAHGHIGTICQLVLADSSTAAGLHDLLSFTLDQRFHSGNFPPTLPAGLDELVQFCHGGPGFIISLETIRPFFPGLESKIDTAIDTARQDLWRRGLLTKTPCLCHGIAGNALALPSHDKMQHFLAYMTSTEMERRGWLHDAGHSDEFVGLYVGEAGRAWVWAILDQRLAPRCIGYNDV